MTNEVFDKLLTDLNDWRKSVKDDANVYVKAIDDMMKPKLHQLIDDVINQTVKECQDELLKQLMEVTPVGSSYPIRAVSQSTILSLEHLLKLKGMTK